MAKKTKAAPIEVHDGARPKVTGASKLMKTGGFKKAKDATPQKYLPSGCYLIDTARGIPGKEGYLQGGVTIIYGPPESGKSTLAYQSAGYLQSLGKQVALLDIEGSFEPEWAEILGVDLDKLIISEVPQFMETALQTALDGLNSKAFDALIIDSLHAVATRREAERKDTIENENPVAALAGKLTQFLRVSKPAMFMSQTAVIAIGHARADIDNQYNPYQLTGGFALKHAADLIIQTGKSQSKKRAPTTTMSEAGELIGHTMSCLVEKARGPGHGRRFDMQFLTGKGFSEAYTMLPMILASKHANQLIQIGGQWYTWTSSSGEEVKVQGKGNVFTWFQDHPTEFRHLFNKYLELGDAGANEVTDGETEEGADTEPEGVPAEIQE